MEHEHYLSPFSWRYGSTEMRQVWSLTTQRSLWRRIWVALAEAQQAAGLVTAAQVEDLKAHQTAIDLDRAFAIESEIHHDLMAEVRTYAEQCRIGGPIIHLGATSMDIEDNADALRLRDALDLVIAHVYTLLQIFADQIDREADRLCMAFTHLQPAEPTTVGYRLAGYAQDLIADYAALRRTRDEIRGKGFKGAVGTRASYAELLRGTPLTPAELEARIMDTLDLPAFTIATQTYPRRQDWDVLNVLAGLAMTLYRFAFDLRLLQSPPIGEWAEPFAAKQVGSSAMPFKRNPINAENIDSLARYVAALPRIAWDNAAHNLLERTLDDSGNRRAMLPDAFLATDEITRRAIKILKDLRIDSNAIQRNLDQFGVFAATERLLMEASRQGGDRQALHELIREHSLHAWESLRHNQPNPLIESLATDPHLTAILTSDQIRDLLRVEGYVGDAPARAREIARMIQTLER
ncbi:MAG: adenylosuccinate lyase [Anaerolineae bacterium]|jgi:adenylosuccinate lyase|nr:adenylosuccinate lyase [Anaerolineae bacterium]